MGKKKEMPEVAEEKISADEDRNELYAMYDKANNQAESEEAPEEAEVTTAKVEEYTESIPEEIDEVAEEPAPEAEEDTVKEEKTVPLAALHEEREKRKANQAKLREIEAQNQELLRDLKKLTEKPVAEEDYEIEDYDSELKASKRREAELERRIKALESVTEKKLAEDSERVKQQKQSELQARLTSTDKKLADSGYPGFNMFTSKVGEVLNRMVEDDPDNIVMDNEDGWMKIYREQIYPEVRRTLGEQIKKDTFDTKKDAKKSANLAGASGQTNKPPKDKDDWSYNDYIAMRQGQAA